MNNKMQAFHARLFQPAEVFNPHAEALAQLTQVNPAQMLNLSSDLDWGHWGTVTA